MDSMTKEELRGLLAGSNGDKYIFDRDTTFIKEQNITVQSGANFYNGSQPQQKKNNEIAKDELPKQETAIENKKSKNVIERILDGVCAVYDSALIKNDYEYAAIYKAIDEIKPFDKFSYAEFVELLSDSGKFNEGELPSSSNISKVIIKGIYPNWKVDGKGYIVTRQIMKIGETFYKAYNKK